MTTMMFTAAPASPARAQSASTNEITATTTASHDIVMRARVAPSCRMTDVAQQIVLSGTTDSGETVNTSVSGQGGFTVDCNTSYAIGLQRSTMYRTPSGTGARVAAPVAKDVRFAGAVPRRVASDATSTAKTVLANTDVSSAEDAQSGMTDAARDLEVIVRMAGLEGQLESHCVMVERAPSGFICNALAGPEDVRQPLPKSTASMIVTGSVQPRSDAGSIAAKTLANAGEANETGPDAQERAMVDKVMKESGRVRTGDRLTVSVTARH